ncbi:hypothetical protein HF521_003360, partial [Silurus meridionalis]
KMAAASISDQDQFNCPVCLELLKDPVTLHCGHSYCKVCIISFWDKEVQKKVYSCPQCRETFTPRPVLCRNNMLAEVVEKLKKNKLQAASAAHHYAGPGDVDCDSCNGRKRKATNSCLVCLASYCEDHLKPHYQSPAFKKHKLVEACVDLQKKICSQHNKVMEIYCQTDQSFICYLCTLDKHRGHDTVSAKAERTEKQNKLREEQLKSQQKVQEKQKKVQELKQTVDIIKKRSQEAVDDNEKIFNEMISSLVKRRSEVKEMIRVQEKAELSRAEQHLKHLEQEITDLQRRVSDLEQLSHTPDHIHFLQVHSLSNLQRALFTVNQHLSFDGVRKSVSDLKKRVEEICQEEFNKIRPQDFCYLTLDPNTAHPFLVLSENHREVMWSETKQQYSDHPERFDSWVQVLCKESVCGRRYWEVDWNSENLVYISVSYKEISRKGQGDESVFGRNSQSWSLLCYSSSVSFSHNGVKTELRGPAASRIGVYVDHSAGTLFFYSISKRLRLLHRVQTTFTQPLYAGFRIGFKSAVKFSEIPAEGPGEAEEGEGAETDCVYYKDFCYLTLDPDTAHPFLVLSENHRAVTWSETKQQYSDHPERFDSWVQVLCKESVCGRRYWEVDWNSENWVYISVSYKEISRKGQGDESVFGRNSQSWSLQCSSSSVSFSHNGVKTELRGPVASKIGVYVDHSAGTLFFYSISKRLRLLHSVQTTFTQPLYAGFRIGFKSA